VFAYCTSLPMVNLPESMVEVGSEAFYQCLSLVSVRLPLQVQESSSSLISTTNLRIHKSAFDKCSKLVSIAFPHNTDTAATNTNTNTNTFVNNIICDFHGCSALEKRRLSDASTTAAHGLS